MTVPSQTLIGRLGEVWLKGQNRRLFLGRLQSNLRARVKAVAPERLPSLEL